MADDETDETVTPDPGDSTDAPAQTQSDNSAEVDDDDKPMTKRELREFLAAQQAEAAKRTAPAKKAAAPAKKAAAPAKKAAAPAAPEPSADETPAPKKRSGVSRAWFGSRAD